LRHVVRLSAHYLSGGAGDAQLLLAWLLHPKDDPLEKAKKDREWASRSLRVLADIWPDAESELQVRYDLERQIGRLAATVPWELSEVPLLAEHLANLRAADSTQTAAIERAIWYAQGFTWVLQGAGIVLAHAAFWLALIFAYPRFPQVQAMFFWNPWTRRIAGLGYVGFLLAWVPFLRRRLFAPFRESLLADARLGEFRADDYFPDSRVLQLGERRQQAIVRAIPEIKGQIVLEGESGFGKSMFLRDLVRRAPQIVVFLPATKCAQGVLEAIQAKLEGPARDPEYLRKLIYAGAIDIAIDGLNEVSAETRARAVQFAESNFKGNLIIATQPMEWSAPPLARTFVLLPLATEQIEAFLSSHRAVLRMPPNCRAKTTANAAASS
jgi:hypothetical protein